MLAGLQRRMGRRIAVLRRHAERNGVDGRHGLEHGFDRLEIVDTVHDAVSARGGDQLVIGIGGKGGQMLVADDLADTDDGDIDGAHGVSLD